MNHQEPDVTERVVHYVVHHKTQVVTQIVFRSLTFSFLQKWDLSWKHVKENDSGCKTPLIKFKMNAGEDECEDDQPCVLLLKCSILWTVWSSVLERYGKHYAW